MSFLSPKTRGPQKHSAGEHSAPLDVTKSSDGPTPHMNHNKYHGKSHSMSSRPQTKAVADTDGDGY